MIYFRPGHETFPVYLQGEPLRVVENAVRRLGVRKSADLIRLAIEAGLI